MLHHDVPIAYSSNLRRGAVASSTLFATQHQQRLFLRTSVPNPERKVTRVSATPFQDEAIKKHGDPWKASTKAQGMKKQATRLIKRDPSISPTEYSTRLRELKYLPDPMKLADFVRDKLKQEKQKEMLDLVRLASKQMLCTVAWNHLVDDRLARGQVSTALKIYNEMKKRAQVPDSHTYLILLRGLANNAHHTNALTHALSTYHSMSAPNSKVAPAILHTNAMLKVCSRANNMDALWGVASKIPERGPGAANNLTFTTILNAIRQSLLVGVPVGLSEEEMAARREEAVVQGRRIWEDVISKWRAADIFLDEELVCAMGRLLLIGSRPRDWDDVLSLVEQTMNIPRLVPRLGSEARTAAGLPTLRAPSVPEAYRNPDKHDSPSADKPRGEEFLHLTPRMVGGSKTTSLAYATPSNNTLSLIQEACLKIVARNATTEYWNLLTDPQAYGIVPDLNNLHMRLRILRQNRASQAALETLQHDIVGRGIAAYAGTFRIAMSACVRDKLNPHALAHAGAILDIMMATLPDADAKVVAMYAGLAFDAPAGAGAGAAVVAALERLEVPLRSLRTQLTLGAERWDGVAGTAALRGERREDALAAVRMVYRLHDRLLLRGEVAGEEATMWKARRARLVLCAAAHTAKQKALSHPPPRLPPPPNRP